MYFVGILEKGWGTPKSTQGPLLDRFAHTLKHMGKERRRPESFTDEILMNLYDDALIAGLPKEIAHEIELSKVMTT